MKTKYLLLIFTLLILKVPFLFINHIQEDAFITWRVAQNFIKYGVLGFNGAEKVSASTTHLYTFISIIFNYIFGKNFIYPILIFNTFLFNLGTIFLAKIFFNNFKKIILFTLFIGFIPPALKIQYLGMEYSIIFLLDALLIYYGFYLRNKIALFIIPILLLWTRIDTAIFLGILFIVDLIHHKKCNFIFMTSGIIGTISIFSFNYFYFGEVINQTILAKKYAYQLDYSLEQQIKYAISQLDHYWGVLKMPDEYLNFTTYIIIFIEFICLIIACIKYTGIKRSLLIFFFIFSYVKMSIFILALSLFDWYYWIPQILAFSIILFIILDSEKYIKNSIIYSIFAFPMIGYQIVHSIATANGEWNYRRNIGLYLDKIEKNKNEYIFLEPAGYIPYFSGLKTIDQVGLISKVQFENVKENLSCADVITLNNLKPKYVLIHDIPLETKMEFYKDCKDYNIKNNYKLIKEFKIKNNLNSEYKILEFIYHLKPSGRDYYLYKRIK